MDIGSGHEQRPPSQTKGPPTKVPRGEAFTFMNGRWVIHIPDIVVRTIEELVDQGQVEAFGKLSTHLLAQSRVVPTRGGPRQDAGARAAAEREARIGEAAAKLGGTPEAWDKAEREVDGAFDEVTAGAAAERGAFADGDDVSKDDYIVQAWLFEMCDQAADCAPKYTKIDDLNAKGTLTLHTHPRRACFDRHKLTSLEGKKAICANADWYKPSALDLRTILERALMIHIIATPYDWYVILNNGGEPNMEKIEKFLESKYEAMEESTAAISQFNSMASKIHIFTIPKTYFVRGGTCQSKLGDDDGRCTKTAQRRRCEEDEGCTWAPLRSTHSMVRLIEGFVCLHLP